MSKIPFTFLTPVPKYFDDTGWFKNENTWKFIMWAFSKCQTIPHTIVFNGREITLEPYEFITGRVKSSAECFLTEKEFRGQLISMQKAGYLKKGANSRANRFNTYIWLTERFSTTKGQPKGQPRANRGPTEGHKLEQEQLSLEEEQQPLTPSQESSDGSVVVLSSQKKSEEEKDYVYRDCSLTKRQLDKCVKTHGSLEKVQEVIEGICNWEGRSYTIKNWCGFICKWVFNGKNVDKIKENENLGSTLEKQYKNSSGWSVTVYNDLKKDQKGLLFQALVGNCQPYFVAFSESDFEQKVNELIKTKKMKKKGETK